MSGKPATPAAAGPPRLLLYVADRQGAPPSPARTYAREPPDDRLASDGPPEYEPAPRLSSDPAGGYHTRCPLGPDNAERPMLPLIVHQSQYSDSVSSVIDGNGDSELISDKSYLNYQFLEQSVTHQSIVNQSISILNQQVGVCRGVTEEGEVTSQLLRTPDGLVFVVPPSSDSEPSFAADTQTITVPLGWKRIVSGTSVVYLSPSGSALNTLQQLREYLQTAGTCKCGLPCPLRPENTFSFDPKVVSKPYQPPTGAELTKLCNHKRKLLATLSARTHSPATPPPQEQKKGPSGDFAILKKKMKKRPGYPTNVGVQQLMVQKPINEFKPQDIDPCRTSSPGLHGNRGKLQCPAYPGAQQHNLPNMIQQEADNKLDLPVHRSSHYLTVNSGWITQPQSPDQKNQANPNLNVGMPVLGTNGQIIGVNTSYKHAPNYKNIPPVMPHQEEHKDDKKDQTSNANKISNKEEEPQIFCGLNQPLTPEVMQKINEQQQIFIQQNQKQIEMAMKGYRSQLTDTSNQNKAFCQSQYMQQNQLVIQNGAVVKTNPVKTPPWQVKRAEPITTPSPKSQKSDNMDFEESNTNMSEESSNSNASLHSTEAANQAMCSRVPPLPQHYNMINQWPAFDNNKKKPKNSKASKKKASPIESKISFTSNGMRLLGDPKGKSDDSSGSVPSFMDDPSAYLAQQTALLNNTISRQTMNTSYDNCQYDSTNCFGNQMQADKTKMGKCDGHNMYRSNMVPNPSPSPNTTPDSSMISEKNLDCCKSCNVNVKNHSENQTFSENQIRRTYMKHSMYNKMEDTLASPKHTFDDSPVSSTFAERGSMMNDMCGPIQAGTVSTSNVSPSGTLLPPEPSPTPSNSSRNTDTPQSNGSNGSHSQNCTFPIPSPAYSNPAYNGNPSTPGPVPYNSPGPPSSQSVNGTQMMHFISNHNVNKNLMEVDNISMVGVKPALKAQEAFRQDMRRRFENTMPGYCPPPHLGGGPAHSLIQACYVQSFVTTMASGFSVTRDTMTSVLAGRANTATTSINASSANFIRPPPPPSVNLATSYAIPNNHPDPFIHSVNLPTSYPLHIAGTTAQNMISKSPFEMVQNVIGSSQKSDINTPVMSATVKRQCPGASPGQILISSTGQIIMSNSQMPPPPPPKTSTTIPLHLSNNVTNVTTSVTQVSPVGGVQPIVNQSPTVVVNTLPTPFVIQPPMVVDGQVVQPNQVLPQIVSSGMVTNETRQIEVKNNQGCIQGVAMLSPETLKKKSKKKKGHTNVTNVLQIAAPQQNSNIMVHSSPQHNNNSQFSPRGFQLSPNNNISPAPMLQALTIVPGKSGAPAHIVMNGQGNTNTFGSQQIITNTSPSQQINLLQPVNLINNASSVVPNFPFQQFIVPNLGGMVMTADGPAIIQENATGVPMQLQLQTVNGQNVLTPVQNPGVFATNTNGSVVIRTSPNQQGKIIQSQHSPGAQFLSPNSQVMMSSPNFNGQLSPLLANLSPTNVFNTSPQQMRSTNTQEFIQTNQMGQTLMVPLSPKQVTIAATNSRSNSTFVQQNTTIVQQQTTLVSNSAQNHVSSLTNLQGNSRLSIDPNVLLNSAHKQITNQIKTRNFIELPQEPMEDLKDDKNTFNQDSEKMDNPEYAKFMSDFNPMLGIQGHMAFGSHVRHSVSTQTLVNQQRGKSPNSQAVSGSSPPDTTTHSPLGPLETSSSPRLYGARSMSTQGNYADTTTKSPEPTDANSSAMVQCVSSSEPDMAETREHSAWSNAPSDYGPDTDTQNLMTNMQHMRQTRHAHNSVESTDLHYNHNMPTNMSSQQNLVPMTPNYYDRAQTYKRKNEFEGATYRNEKLIRANYNMVHGPPKDSDYDLRTDKSPKRLYSASGPSNDSTNMQKVFDRHTLGNNDSTNTEDIPQEGNERPARKFEVGDLIWGPVKGYASWPGKLVMRADDGRWNVRWFGGDKAPCFVEDAKLLTLSEGLEAHHAARTKHRKSRKLNTHLENAIQEAMSELDKKSDSVGDVAPETSTADHEDDELTETPKRKKKSKKKTGNLVKIATNTGKVGDGTRLRSAR